MLMRIFARTRVTKLTLPSPSIVITENQVLGNSWIHSERAGLGTSSRSAGVRFTAAVERSWGARRPVNAGLLALSTLQSDVRRRLLGRRDEVRESEDGALIPILGILMPKMGSLENSVWAIVRR
jgi:hypothetical protein